MNAIPILLALLACIPFAGCADAAAVNGGRTDSKTPSVAKKAPRRAVPQVIEPVAPVVPASRQAPPTPAAPTPAAPIIVPQIKPSAPPPAVTGCDPGGCWDSGGNRYNGSAGGALLDRNGRLCQRNGVSIQCF